MSKIVSKARRSRQARTSGSAAGQLAGMGIGITGGGGHLGMHMALACAAAGAVVVITGRTADRLRMVEGEARRHRLPGRIIACVADSGRAEDIERVLDLIVRSAGAVHGWANNAYAGAPGLLLDATPEQVAATLRAGLMEPFRALQQVAKRMRLARGGSIVNVASMYGLVSPQPSAYAANPEFHNPPAYGCAKAALLQLTRYAACHLGSRGVRVNSLVPGPFPAPGVAKRRSFIKELSARVPLGRVGNPKEIGGPLVFLLSQASSYMTGAQLVVDGGWTAW